MKEQEFKKRVFEALQSLGLSQAWLGKRICKLLPKKAPHSVTTTLNVWFHNEDRGTKAEILLAICEIFGWTIDTKDTTIK
jgi:hypothetical protein